MVCDFLAINSQRDSPFCKYEMRYTKEIKIIFLKNADAYVVLWLKTEEKDIIFIKIKKP